MYKIGVLICFLGIYFVQIVASDFPFVRYYYHQSTNQCDPEKFEIDNHQVVTGDKAYLSALIQRGKDKDKAEKENRVPEPQTNSPSYVFLLSEIITFNNPVVDFKLNYFDHIWCLSKSFHQILSPPPKNFY